MSFVPVRVSTLRGDIKIPFDLYIPIAGKTLHYIRRGDSFEGERLSKLKEKKLKKMLIKEEDEANYRKYIAESFESAIDPKSGKPLEVRAQVVQGATQSNTEELLENPENAVSYELAKSGADKYVDFLLREEKALKSIMSIANTDKNMAHHGVNVSSLAVMLSGRVGYKDPKSVKLMTLGALIHDFGHTLHQIDIARPIKELTAEELKIYREHPRLGAEKIKNLKHFDQQVIQIIFEHEETSDGSGFPQGLSGSKLNTFSLIVSLANAFDRLISFENKTPGDAMKSMMIDRMGQYPLEYLTALKSVLGEQGLI